MAKEGGGHASAEELKVEALKKKILTLTIEVTEGTE